MYIFLVILRNKIKFVILTAILKHALIKRFETLYIIFHILTCFWRHLWVINIHGLNILIKSQILRINQYQWHVLTRCHRFRSSFTFNSCKKPTLPIVGIKEIWIRALFCIWLYWYNMGSPVHHTCFVIAIEKMSTIVRIWKDVFWIGYTIIRNINCWNNIKTYIIIIDKLIYYTFCIFFNRLKYLDQLLLCRFWRQGGNNLVNISQKTRFYYGNTLRSLASKLVMGTH